MDREQIIKDLEDMNMIGVSPVAIKNAVKLIKELTAENERLRDSASSKCEDCAGCTSWKCDCANIEADTVKRMQVLLHKKANYKVCGYYCVSTDDIDEIAKKVIGGKK